MHAIQVTEIGEPGVLRWSEVEPSVPGPGEVLVRVAAAGVNYIDTYHRTGLYPMPLPFTPGLEGAGDVVAVGEGVQLQPGDRVAWSNAIGSYAEQVIVPAGQAVAIPDGVDLETAAASMLQGMTAHYLAHDTFPLQAGQRCLIHAGAGGVGLALIQMAKQIGAEVFTTVSTEEKAELAGGAGADHVIRYDKWDFGDNVERIGGERCLDVIYDGVGQSTFARGLELLRKRGMLVLFGQSSGPVEPVDLGTLARNGSLYVTRPRLFDYIADRAALEARAGAVLAAVAAGELSIRIGHRWRMAEAAEAHRALEARATSGKVLLIPG
ncbi:MAG TPA: quinone oxidoreductase [Acidimicrobiia bacterium]|jgi:NADPH2:quinone reductase|nr:quinone oxidoreductase [Acidimicrobiia bacterium]